jgi:hypothetical protein
MKIRILGVTTFILAAVAIPAGMAGCDEPQTQCQVGHATSFEYAMQYTVTQQSAGCMGANSPLNSGFFTPSTIDGHPIAVNQVAFEDYHPATGLNTRDVSQTTVYIETDDVQGLQAAIECYQDDDPDVGYLGQQLQGTDQPWEMANFTNQFPDSNNMCQLKNISPATGVVGTFAAANPAPSCGPASGCLNYDVYPDEYNMSCVCVGHCSGALTCDGDTESHKSKCAAGGAAEGDVCGDTSQGHCRATCNKDGSTCGAGANAATECAAQTENCCDAVDPLKGPTLTSCHEGPQTISAKTSYDWENVQFYTTADAPGTQVSATLTYSVGSCQATIAARGVWPAISCVLTASDGRTPVYTDGNPLASCITDGDCVDAMGNPLQGCDANMQNCKTLTCIQGFCGGRQADPAACCTNPEVDQGHASGSTINGDFNVHCDPDALLCVLNGDAKDGIPVLDATGVPDTCPAEISVQ